LGVEKSIWLLKAVAAAAALIVIQGDL